MTTKYYAILTNQGAARLANAAALGTKLNLTQMAVGDANGIFPTPDPAQTKLINQKRIAPLNMLSIDPNNPDQIIAEQVIPENEGGFWIREIGLYDDEGVLIAVANSPETYKPQLQEGSGRTQTLRMILVVSNTATITLKVDPSVVLATRQYVDDRVIEVKQYTDSVMKKHVDAINPHPQYPLIANALKEMVDAGLVNEVLKNLGLGEAAKQGVATAAQMQSGTATNLLPSVAAVMSLFSKRVFSTNDFVRIPDVPGGLIIQYLSLGNTAGNSDNVPVTWPVPFTQACRCILVQDTGTSASAITQWKVKSRSTTGCFLMTLGSTDSAANYTADIFVMGY